MAWWNAIEPAGRIPPTLGLPSAKKGKPWSEKERTNHEGKHRHWSKTQPEEAQLLIREKIGAAHKGAKRSQEYRDRISKTLRDRWDNDTNFRARLQEVNGSPSRREKLRVAAYTRWNDPEWRSRQVDKIRASRKPVPLELRKQIAAKLQGRKKPVRTEEHCKNLSLSLRKPETLAKLREQAIEIRRNYSRPNKQELVLSQLLNKIFPREFKLNVSASVVIGSKIPDFVSRTHNVVVELFGDYWHSLKLTGRTRRQEEYQRKQHFRKHGFETVIIWQSELSFPDKIIRKIRKALL